MEDNQLNWYAVKVFFNKVFEWEDHLHVEGFETYVAVAHIHLKGEAHQRAARQLALGEDAIGPRRYFREGPVLFERKPLVPSLLFVQASEEDILRIDDALGKAGFVYKKADRSTYAPIPPVQMQSFRLATSAGQTGLEFFSADNIAQFRQGDRVRVTEGPLKGTEGYVKRIRKDRRLLVCIDGVVAVATSYIPPRFLEIVPESS